MLIFQSILVYGFIIWVMTYFGNIAYKTQYPRGIGGVDMYQNRKVPFSTLLTKSYYLIPIFVFCFFAAIRFKVGVDCESYKVGFYELVQFRSVIHGASEPGFIAISRIVAATTGSHYLLFFILAFLQISFLYYAVRKNNLATIYLGLSIMLSGTFFSLMNGMRQNIAACILVAAIPLILEKKNWIWFIALAFLAASMHKSAYLFIPIGILSYFLLKKGILNIYLQLAIIAVCYLLMDKIELSFLDVLFSYGEHAGYDSAAIENYTEYVPMTKNFGFSSWLLLLTQIVCIIYSKRMQALNSDKVFNIIYNLFFIGVCIKLLLYNNFTIGRLNYYFIIFYPVVLSIALFVMSCSKKKIDRQIFAVTILLLVASFSFNLYKAMGETLEFTLYKFDLFN